MICRLIEIVIEYGWAGNTTWQMFFLFLVNCFWCFLALCLKLYSISYTFTYTVYIYIPTHSFNSFLHFHCKTICELVTHTYSTVHSKHTLRWNTLTSCCDTWGALRDKVLKGTWAIDVDGTAMHKHSTSSPYHYWSGFNLAEALTSIDHLKLTVE